MKISETIKKLEQIKEEHGDLPFSAMGCSWSEGHEGELKEDGVYILEAEKRSKHPKRVSIRWP